LICSRSHAPELGQQNCRRTAQYPVLHDRARIRPLLSRSCGSWHQCPGTNPQPNRRRYLHPRRHVQMAHVGEAPDETGFVASSHTCVISSDSSSSSRVRFACSFRGARQSFAQCPFLPELRQVSRLSLPSTTFFFFLCPRGRLLDPPLPEPALELFSPCCFSFKRACHCPSVSSSLPPTTDGSSSSSPRPSTALNQLVISSIDMVEMSSTDSIKTATGVFFGTTHRYLAATFLGSFGSPRISIS
jgi:hypothetical protein